MEEYTLNERRTIFHVDANSAYLSWEAVYRIQHGDTVDLREIPSIIGGAESTRHGIVLAKSLACKPYKIQTGEPVRDALAKCPGLVVVPPNYYLYMQCSSSMNQIFKEFSDRVQPFSIDESFIDFTGMERVLGDPMTAANQLRERVKKTLGFTVSIGISMNKLLIIKWRVI